MGGVTHDHTCISGCSENVINHTKLTEMVATFSTSLRPRIQTVNPQRGEGRTCGPVGGGLNVSLGGGVVRDRTVSVPPVGTGWAEVSHFVQGHPAAAHLVWSLAAILFVIAPC